jgi:hypothetical protein
MGTNYYHSPDGIAKETHIGKQSYGWAFLFRGYFDLLDNPPFDLHSYQDWLELFKREGGCIIDEEGKVISLDEFKKMVEENRHKKRQRYGTDRGCWIDDEGYVFDSLEFS